MKKIKLGMKELYAKVDNADYEILSQSRWFSDGGYAYCWYGYKSFGKNKKMYMHRMLMQPADGFVVDHINRDKLDNRRSNLRVCRQLDNCQNRNKSKANKSGTEGVFFRKDRNKWTVYANYNGRRKYFGHYSDINKAISVRKAVVVEFI